jgi:tRNA A22 N-methylase
MGRAEKIGKARREDSRHKSHLILQGFDESEVLRRVTNVKKVEISEERTH